MAGTFLGGIPRNISDEMIVGIPDEISVGILLVAFGGNINSIKGKNLVESLD